MIIGGVIAEYNPFHLGHQKQLALLRAEGVTHLVVVMSGNFVQRGEPALFSKWVRARAALLCGADLVVELPTPHAMAPAKDFARAGVWALGALGAADLWFGSECGELSLLQAAADHVRQAEQSPLFAELLSTGMGYPKAREEAVRALFGEQSAALLREPNNLLGMEYLAAIDEYRLPMTAHTHCREGASHDGAPVGDTASASWIRRQIRRGDFPAAAPYLPPQVLPLYQAELANGFAPPSAEKLDLLLWHALWQSDAPALSTACGIAEGLEHRILREAAACRPLEELVAAVSGKRYTLARVRRSLMNHLLGIRQGAYPKEPQYLRILGMNRRGTEVLKAARKQEIAILPKFADLAAQGFSEALLEARATDMYTLLQPTASAKNREFTEPPILLWTPKRSQ